MGGVSAFVHRATVFLAFVHLIHGSGCATAVPAPAHGTGTLAGQLEVRSPVADSSAGSGQSAYGDRRLRDAARVDYSRTGFAVVYLELAEAAVWQPGPTTITRITLSDGPVHVRIDPDEVALRVGSRVAIRNASRDPHVVSIPGLGRVSPLEPDGVLEFEVDRSGDLALYLLDRPGVSARLFSAAGPFMRVADTGRFVLADLPPGMHRLHVWHSRLPPTSSLVELESDRIEWIDLVVGSPDLHGD
jgi:hypothetical protein